MKKIGVNLLFLMFLLASSAYGKKNEMVEVVSPDGSLKVSIAVTDEITWSLEVNDNLVAGPSAIALEVEDYGIFGEEPVLRNSFPGSRNEIIETSFYKKSKISNQYNELNMIFKGGYSLIFRAYNDGIAYRFVTSIKNEIKIKSEKTEFVFPDASEFYVPYVREPVGRYQVSFESTYDVLKLEEIDADSLIITPLLVKNNDGTSLVVSEADLEDYPGMFLSLNDEATGFEAEYAGYPLEEEQGGHNNLQSYVTKRADFIAKTHGNRAYPWRMVAVGKNDAELLDNDLVYKLASPSRIEDTSWIKPGKVAWDWWNDWNIYNVDFQAGINTETYKYYIDFAAEKGIEYVILDEGWSESTNLLNVIPEIDLQEIVDHANSKGVDIVLWAGWLPLNQKMDEVFEKYSEMGVKGYKIDFMNRDDQKMVNFYYKTAEKAAEYEQFVLFHGAYKPTGLHRTYPNVLTYEGVFGLEQVKWTEYDNFPEYDVTVPYIRMLAGPMDYTPGAMENANRFNWRAVHSDPMSQGTRVHQLAMYVVFDSPFSMLCDNPTNYLREPESVEFIASVPTVFDETVPLAGEIGDYVAVARRKGDTWYVGAMTDWNGRELELDFSFLGDGAYKATVFADGINADRAARDYTKEEITINGDQKLKIEMKSGGGWAAVIEPVR
ncbi:glycoside hydrolase family 97 protein [Marinilabilia salmonicolor]|jgi:alpha-glucosidase|uniref:Alpha-glucosidase n=1 Tax=Marinilabilia salmonicolor TaxID=989 RepID=A0A2T0XBB3_9BACT|nr:glycoside hydrolase family 97 protein [Marinilabilia salmonicolor]PRY96199.1 alpha-glucosidase [Marinilabilia salmonicolor]RCW35294.1 alpha-glucosidase [Marinilabilia salmonicolor]